MKFLNWIRRSLLNLLSPFLHWIRLVHFPFTHKKVNGLAYYDLFPLLEPGLVFVCHTRGEGTNYIIMSFFTHAAIYTPMPEQKIDEIVTEAEGVGVLRTDLISFMTTKDAILALKPILPAELEKPVMKRAAEIALTLYGDAYDYGFEDWTADQKEFFCSKVPWYSYDMACNERGLPSLFNPKMSLGVRTVTPQDIAEDTENFRVVWDSRQLKK